ncbi:MAG TPA: hypothetical protein VKA16_07295 [Burkholderiales bacterium]|nr:hypothetical protein [Burkholderiales bacterium]
MRKETSIRRAGTLFCFASALLLASCASDVQTYSSPQHQTLRLQTNELAEGGLAFLTPSTVTGQEEDKQSLAYVFADTLKSQRPEIRFAALPQTIGAVNRAGLAETYRRMYRDYRDTGVFDEAMLKQVAQAAGVRYLVQLKLANMEQGARGRFSLLGLSLLNTQYANMRVFFQVWDSRDGSIAWEGTDEVSMAFDTGQERRLTFRKIAERAAQDLIASLP